MNGVSLLSAEAGQRVADLGRSPTHCVVGAVGVAEGQRAEAAGDEDAALDLAAVPPSPPWALSARISAPKVMPLSVSPVMLTPKRTREIARRSSACCRVDEDAAVVVDVVAEAEPGVAEQRDALRRGDAAGQQRRDGQCEGASSRPSVWTPGCGSRRRFPPLEGMVRRSGRKRKRRAAARLSLSLSR